ncbi:MAG: hydantoinase/oxoprolinase family protein, partial [Actinomycetes bacterium]
LDPDDFANGRMTLDAGAARRALGALGERLGMDEDATAVAAVRLVDAHMTDAIRRVLSLAGVDPRRLDLVAFGGMGAVHGTTQAAALGMRRVLIPRAAAGLAALGLMIADHVVDDSRGYLAPWQEADLEVIRSLASDLEEQARQELAVAGVPDERITLEWSLLLVYPGQTFDSAIPVPAPTDLGAAVAEFHRRNEEARLIEARAQEPMIRGVRLTAVGRVDKPRPVTGEPGAPSPEPVRYRRLWGADSWHDQAPVWDLATLGTASTVVGPGLIQSPFTTIVLRPGDTARARADGDVIVDVA